MRGLFGFLAIALGIVGCRSNAPTTDPFNRYTVPPPSTNSFSTDSAYPQNSISIPPSSNLTGKAGGPVSNANASAPTNANAIPNSGGAGWTLPGVNGQNPSSINANSGITNPGISNPNNATNVNGASNPSGNRSNGATSASPGIGYGASNMPAYNSVYGNQPLATGNTATIIPPPGTSPGGYANSSALPPSSTMPTQPTANGFGAFNGYDNSRGSLIRNTPRPTSAQASMPSGRPANAVPMDFRSPRPVDDTAQPGNGTASAGIGPSNSTAAAMNSASTPYANSNMNSVAPQNSIPTRYVAIAPQQPSQMPIPPTAYGSPFAAQPQCAGIQTIVIEPNWQPCDDWEDGGE